jgi:large subunit ribosomal protein L19
MNVSNNSKNLIQLVESKHIQNRNIGNDGKSNIEVGAILRIGYTIQEGEKERIQYYEGLVIGEQNRGLGRTFTLRRSVQGIGVEQIFLVNSPKITSIVKKQSSKVRRAKLYFIRELRGKSTRLKQKF